MIAKAIVNESLAKKYELSYRINPFYLRGDFNGGGNGGRASREQERSSQRADLLEWEALHLASAR